MENLKELVTEIKTGLSQVSSSQKDEVRVMKAMLNDREYEAEIYGKEGKVGTFNPAMAMREMLSNVIAGTTKISNEEAKTLAEGYDFKRGDAETLVETSKEFVNSYLQTGRKLPLGGRERSNVSFIMKEVPETVRSYPRKVGVNSDGSDRYEKIQTKVPAYESVKVVAPCPSWNKAK